MAITLAADGLSDAEITDGVARGDISSAARLWVRLWPTALNTAREVVDPAEGPALAAKALIGTIAVIALGRGPREDVKSFLRGAVRELGDDGPPPPPSPGAWSPDVSKSPIMSGAYARLPDLVQDLLWITVVGDRADEMIAEALEITTTAAAAVRIDALTTLQRDHLAAHAALAEDPACRPAHHALARAVEDPGAAGLSRETWMHLSACAWCTEAFHEVVFSNAAIGALVDRAAASRVVPPSVAPATEATDGGGVVAAPAPMAPHADPPPSDRTHVGAASSSPGRVRRRGRGLAGAVAVLAAAAVVVLIVVGHGSDRSAPPVAAGPPASTPVDAALQGGSPSLTSTPDVTASAGTAPGTDLPSTTPTPRAPKSPDASSSSKPTPSPQPSATTSSSAPAQTPPPTPQPPPSTPTQTPSPTPTPTPEPCSVLAHLLGLC